MLSGPSTPLAARAAGAGVLLGRGRRRQRRDALGRVEGLARAVGVVVVELGGDGDDGLAGADQAVEHRLHRGGHPLLVLAGLLVGHAARRSEPPIAESTVPWESMTATSSGFMPWMPAETRWTIDWTCAASSVGAALGLDEDGRRRVGRLGDEDGLLGHRELDGRGLDAVDRADGLGELALHRALQGDLLLELRGGHAHVVQQRVAAAVGRRRAGPPPRRVSRGRVQRPRPGP